MPTNNCNHDIWKHPSKIKFDMYHKVSCKSNNFIYLLLIIRMSALQNAVCQKVGNFFSHKIEPPTERI